MHILWRGRGEKIYQPAEIWPILSKRLICLNKRWKLMTALFVTKCSQCNYDASVLGFSVVALSSQIPWCITPGCLAITFREGRCAYLSETVTLHPLKPLTLQSFARLRRVLVCNFLYRWMTEYHVMRHWGSVGTRWTSSYHHPKV